MGGGKQIDCYCVGTIVSWLMTSGIPNNVTFSFVHAFCVNGVAVGAMTGPIRSRDLTEQIAEFRFGSFALTHLVSTCLHDFLRIWYAKSAAYSGLRRSMPALQQIHSSE